MMNPQIPPVTKRILGDMEQDELCRKAGFPTITEQRAYWQTKEGQDQLLAAVDAFSDFLNDMTFAIGKLKAKFETLAKRNN